MAGRATSCSIPYIYGKEFRCYPMSSGKPSNGFKQGNYMIRSMFLRITMATASGRIWKTAGTETGRARETIVEV